MCTDVRVLLLAQASHKTAPHTRKARVSPRPLHGTPPERAHQITPPLHDQGACTSGSVVSQLGRLCGAVRGGVGACGVLDPGRGLSLSWLQPFPSGSPTHHNALTPPRTPPSNLQHGTGYRTARGTARHGVPHGTSRHRVPETSATPRSRRTSDTSATPPEAVTTHLGHLGYTS